MELIDFPYVSFELLRGEIRPDMEITDLCDGHGRTCRRPMGKGECGLGYAELALAPKVAIDEQTGHENKAHARKELKAQCQGGLNRQMEFGKGEKESADGDEEREERP